MKKLSFMVAAILVFASAPKVLMAAPAVMAVQDASENVVDYTSVRDNELYLNAL